MNLDLRTPLFFLYGIAAVAYILAREHYGWSGRLADGVYGAFGALLMQLFRETSRSMKSYEPTSKLDAKIANEKIKLLASTMNALALGLGLTGVVVPMLNTGENPVTNVLRMICVIFAFWIHVAARGMLNNLKDEEAFSKADAAPSSAPA